MKQCNVGSIMKYVLFVLAPKMQGALNEKFSPYLAIRVHHLVHNTCLSRLEKHYSCDWSCFLSVNICHVHVNKLLHVYLTSLYSLLSSKRSVSFVCVGYRCPSSYLPDTKSEPVGYILRYFIGWTVETGPLSLGPSVGGQYKCLFGDFQSLCERLAWFWYSCESITYNYEVRPL